MNPFIAPPTLVTASPAELDLHRQLVEQFYRTSVERYGVKGEQSRLFAQHLSAYAGHEPVSHEYDSQLP